MLCVPSSHVPGACMHSLGRCKRGAWQQGSTCCQAAARQIRNRQSHAQQPCKLPTPTPHAPPGRGSPGESADSEDDTAPLHGSDTDVHAGWHARHVQATSSITSFLHACCVNMHSLTAPLPSTPLQNPPCLPQGPSRVSARSSSWTLIATSSSGTPITCRQGLNLVASDPTLERDKKQERRRLLSFSNMCSCFISPLLFLFPPHHAHTRTYTYTNTEPPWV
jgi:hypothetical protein